MSLVQFSSGYITFQGGLLYWLVSLIQIGPTTLMIGSLLLVMFSALVQDLPLGPIRKNRLFHFIYKKKTTKSGKCKSGTPSKVLVKACVISILKPSKNCVNLTHPNNARSSTTSSWESRAYEPFNTILTTRSIDLVMIYQQV
jgi:hypothetical protein